VVRDLLSRHGDELATSLLLLVEDMQGETTVITDGAALADRARQTTMTREQRSA
jgi:hypothetical protein